MSVVGDDQVTVRIRLDVAYDGTDFSGWATQPDRRTVQSELASALGTILRSDPPQIVVGGRTDAGVHARGSVAHADVPADGWAALPGRSDRAPHTAAVTRLAGVLPADIVVRSVSVVGGDFDARFSALRRRYSYRICDHPGLLDPLRRRDTVVLKSPLDVNALNEASQLLLGLHDFAAFCKPREGATTIRTLERFDWQRLDDLTVQAAVVADAFCHSMVRSLVGAVVSVGQGRHEPQWVASVLSGRHRDPRVTVMPAHGLCLEEISYPPPDQLAARAEQAKSVREDPGQSSSCSSSPIR